MRVFALPEVDQQFEDTHEQKRVVTLPYCTITLDQKEEKLIEILEATMDVSQEQIGFIEQSDRLQEAEEISNECIDLLLVTTQLHQTATEPFQNEKNRFQTTKLEEAIRKGKMLYWCGFHYYFCLGSEEGEA